MPARENHFSLSGEVFLIIMMTNSKETKPDCKTFWRPKYGSLYLAQTPGVFFHARHNSSHEYENYLGSPPQETSRLPFLRRAGIRGGSEEVVFERPAIGTEARP
jgi:hypothetical protein